MVAVCCRRSFGGSSSFRAVCFCSQRFLRQHWLPLAPRCGVTVVWPFPLPFRQAKGAQETARRRVVHGEHPTRKALTLPAHESCYPLKAVARDATRDAPREGGFLLVLQPL